MEQLEDHALNIYTDGSSYQRPRRGGIGVRFVLTGGGRERDEVHDYEPLPGYRESTNNEMEIWAAVTALRLTAAHGLPVDLAGVRKIVVWTDSLYVQEHYMLAMGTWKRDGWRKRDGSPVENAELWADLDKAIRKAPFPVTFKWVKGKKGEHTKAVDKLAKKSAQNPQHGPLTVRQTRRKTTQKPLQKGSVRMEGQVLDILVFNGRWSQRARLHRYSYQVISEGPYFDCADTAWTGELMRGNHHYRVRMNAKQDDPRIEEVICELDRETGECMEEP